jgi:hypothetical protein
MVVAARAHTHCFQKRLHVLFSMFQTFCVDGAGEITRKVQKVTTHYRL